MNADARFVMLAPIAPLIGVVVFRLPHVGTAHQIAGLALTVVGLGLITLARWQLGNAFSIAPEARTLVTRGLYSRIRNPIYVFGLTLMAGMVLYLDVPWLLLAVIPVAAMQFIRAGREAKVLEARFGDAYREYRQSTWF